MKLLKKSKKKDVLKILANDLTANTDDDVLRNFRESVVESFRLRSGGRARVRGLAGTMTVQKELSA